MCIRDRYNAEYTAQWYLKWNYGLDRLKIKCKKHLPLIVKYLGWKLETERTDKLRKAGHMYLLRGSILVLKGGRWSKWKKNRSKKNAING